MCKIFDKFTDYLMSLSITCSVSILLDEFTDYLVSLPIT